MVKSVPELRAELADRESIRECIHRYARAIDRGQWDLLRTVYWPDAIDHHPGFGGTVEEFIAWAAPQQQGMQNCMHLLNNIFIQIDGADALVETYFCSLLVVSTGAIRETLVCGRYLDRFECRGGDWRIAARMVVHDWLRQHADTSDWSAAFPGVQVERGVLGPQDKSFTWLGLR